MEDLLEVGKATGMSWKKRKDIAEEIQERVETILPK